MEMNQFMHYHILCNSSWQQYGFPMEIELIAFAAGAPTKAQILNFYPLWHDIDTFGKFLSSKPQPIFPTFAVPVNKQLTCLVKSILAQMESAINPSQWSLLCFDQIEPIVTAKIEEPLTLHKALMLNGFCHQSFFGKLLIDPR
ncbi:hypothetical protein AO718_07015 [Aeromonas veronii]|nr:hypothetical protein AO718_07015 [Aeromonas veronii]KRW01683.1 hypothetical protein AO725_16450 [Aeromonas veronii]KRW11072.1 hypothetical protein AO745_15930 [Aeromonas veronii]KRW12770.1 hypothetical protein AO732_18695 [Aeromonas veronii]KRW20835.1 hypothetical protein AO734_18435 [Aeromonas veronii]